MIPMVLYAECNIHGAFSYTSFQRGLRNKLRVSLSMARTFEDNSGKDVIQSIH